MGIFENEMEPCALRDKEHGESFTADAFPYSCRPSALLALRLIEALGGEVTILKTKQLIDFKVVIPELPPYGDAE